MQKESEDFMRTRKMRLISALLAVAMIFIMIPVGAFADDENKNVRTSADGKFKYSIDESGNATIIDYLGSGDTTLTIDKIDGYPVVAIDEFAFNVYEYSQGNGDAEEEDYAAKYGDWNDDDENPAGIHTGAAPIERIVLAPSVKKIGLSAFRGCTALKDINLENVDFIEGAAFEECTDLDSVTLADGLSRIEECAFAGCTNLKEITPQCVF